MELQEKKYKEHTIYYYSPMYEKLGEDILEKKYKEISRIKDTLRNLVVLIEWRGKKYILKEPRNEHRIIQRKLMTFFKKGEALTTLVQVHHLRNSLNCKEYIEPYVAIVKREKGMIVFSALITEFSEGRQCFRDDLDSIVERMQQIHGLGYYHGDFNPSNFLIETREGKDYFRILDTQGKKMGITKYRAHYDMLTMKLDSYKDMKYPYKKTFSYYLAIGMKRMKKLKWIKYLKKKRSEWRDRKK